MITKGSRGCCASSVCTKKSTILTQISSNISFTPYWNGNKYWWCEDHYKSVLRSSVYIVKVLDGENVKRNYREEVMF